MGESDKSLFRRGMISRSQMGPLNATLAATRHQNARMEGSQDDDMDADDRGGLRDQGGRRDNGHPVARVRRAINIKQDLGSPARASGRPSRGGSVGKGRGPRQPVVRKQIDAAASQKPDFPRSAGYGRSAPKPFNAAPTPGGGKPVPTSGGKVGTPKRIAGTSGTKTGGYYGGGGRNTQ